MSDVLLFVGAFALGALTYRSYVQRQSSALPALATELERYASARGKSRPCEFCGERRGNTLDRGWYRCNACGEPSQ